jgi:hypothetical protein
MARTYNTRNDAILWEIVKVIEASGEVKDARAEYDVDAIANQVLTTEATFDPPRVPTSDGSYGASYVWRLADGLDGDAEFWEIVAAHALSTDQH